MTTPELIPLDYILSQAEKPGRYCGGELNTVRRRPEDADLSLCLIYPDTYEVGMPFLGFQILYHLINRNPRLLAERCYAPWTDMEELLRKHEIPLFSLENRRALSDFDILGFTLPYELNYTNILNILDLGHIPVRRQDRQENHPLILAGGACALNPEPIADFIDIFFMGDAEDAIEEILEDIRVMKMHGRPRRAILQELNRPGDGLYVPEFYTPGSAAAVQVRKVTNLRPEHYPIRPIIPLIDITHDRFALEIQRGCTEGCRFCQAGMINRPVRERPAADLIAQTRQTIEATGFEEMSLLSLNTSDYSSLDPLLEALDPFAKERNLSISFPSLRLDNISEPILKMAASQRKSGFTFAPEAGSQRLRNVINKNISDEDLFSTVELALQKGWKTLKFYYMLGLPTETREDLQAMVDQIRHIHILSRKYGRVTINVTLSSFIPKPFTPFQWERQCSPDEFQEKIDFIKSQLHLRNLNLKSRDPEASRIEGLLARGGAAMAGVIYKAWSSGAKFDAWKDKFKLNIWSKALEDLSPDADDPLGEKEPGAPLPWDFIDTGLTRDFLMSERQKAVQETLTRDCRDGCTLCGVCDFKSLKMQISAKESEAVQMSTPEVARPEEEEKTSILMRLHFEKKGTLRYTGHHEIFRILQRAGNILGLPLVYSSGFNRRPRISMGFPVPMGYEALNEALDMEFHQPVSDIAATLNTVLPKGFCILRAAAIEKSESSVMSATHTLCYEARFLEEEDARTAREKLPEILAGDSLHVMRHHPRKGDRMIDLKPFLIEASVLSDRRLQACFRVIEGRSVKLAEFLSLLFPDQTLPPFLGIRTDARLA